MCSCIRLGMVSIPEESMSLPSPLRIERQTPPQQSSSNSPSPSATRMTPDWTKFENFQAQALQNRMGRVQEATFSFSRARRAGRARYYRAWHGGVWPAPQVERLRALGGCPTP